MAKNDKKNEVVHTSYGEASAAELRDIFKYCYKAHMPVMVVGDPGVGKTALINDWTRKMFPDAPEPVLLIGSQLEPQDIVGLPMASEVEINGKKITTTDYGAPWWQVELMSGKRKVIFMDEFSNSPATIQSGLLKLVGDRVFGNGEKLPDDVFIVMAMNPESSAVDYTPIAAPMANRIAFISYRPSDTEVYDGLTGGWFTEEQIDAWSTEEKQWRNRIVDFLRSVNGAYVLKMNDIADGMTDSTTPAFLRPENEKSESEREILTTTWCSPRAWDNVARILGQMPFERDVTPLQERILAGTVGRAATSALEDYVHAHSMIDAFELIKNPKLMKWDVGDEDVNYNEVVECARAVIGKICKCDGIGDRPTVVDAIAFYEKIIDLGGGAHFMSSYCQGDKDEDPGHWIKNHRPNDVSQAEWSKRCNDLLIKFMDAGLIVNKNKDDNLFF